MGRCAVIGQSLQADLPCTGRLRQRRRHIPSCLCPQPLRHFPPAAAAVALAPAHFCPCRARPCGPGAPGVLLELVWVAPQERYFHEARCGTGCCTVRYGTVQRSQHTASERAACRASSSGRRCMGHGAASCCLLLCTRAALVGQVAAIHAQMQSRYTSLPPPPAPGHPPQQPHAHALPVFLQGGRPGGAALCDAGADRPPLRPRGGGACVWRRRRWLWLWRRRRRRGWQHAAQRRCRAAGRGHHQHVCLLPV